MILALAVQQHTFIHHHPFYFIFILFFFTLFCLLYYSSFSFSFYSLLFYFCSLRRAVVCYFLSFLLVTRIVFCYLWHCFLLLQHTITFIYFRLSRIKKMTLHRWLFRWVFRFFLSILLQFTLVLSLACVHNDKFAIITGKTLRMRVCVCVCFHTYMKYARKKMPSKKIKSLRTMHNAQYISVYWQYMPNKSL